MNYQPAKPDVTNSDLGKALLSGLPLALLHQGEAAGEVSIPCWCASRPSVGRDWGRRWKEYVGKIHSLGHGNVKGERMAEDIGRTFLYSLLVPLFSLWSYTPPQTSCSSCWFKKYSPAVRRGVLSLSCEAVVTPSFPFLSVMQAVRMKFQTLQCCSRSVCVEKLED